MLEDALFPRWRGIRRGGESVWCVVWKRGNSVSLVEETEDEFE